MEQSYVVIKDFSFSFLKGIRFEKGDILKVYSDRYTIEINNNLSLNENYKAINFSDENYFLKINQGELFAKGTEVIYRDKLWAVDFHIVEPNGKLSYMLEQKDGAKERTKADNSRIKIIKRFYFINSSGDVQSDYEERIKLGGLRGLDFKKLTGNYFLTKEEANKALDEIVKKAVEKKV